MGDEEWQAEADDDDGDEDYTDEKAKAAHKPARTKPAARRLAKRRTPSSVSLPDEAMEEAYTDEDDEEGLGLGRGTRLGAQDEVAADFSTLQLKPDHINRCVFAALGGALGRHAPR